MSGMGMMNPAMNGMNTNMMYGGAGQNMNTNPAQGFQTGMGFNN
jgi:hypothetical protein